MRRLGAQVSLLSAALLLLLCCGVPRTEQNSYCQQIITADHLAQLQELADTQMLHPGRVSFTFLHKEQLNDSVCYVKAAFPVLGALLGRVVFKENSSNARRLRVVQRMYDRIDENVEPCIREEADEERELSQNCLAELSTSPYEMLVLVKRFFEELAVLLQRRETFAKDCGPVYRARCPAPPRPTAPAPGVGTDPEGQVLSPALPPATQPSLSAASAPGPSGHPHGALAWPPATEGGSGAEEEPGTWLGAPASPGSAVRAPDAPPAAPGPAAGDISVPPGAAGAAQRAPQAGTAAPERLERRGAPVLLPAEAPGEASGAGLPPEPSSAARSREPPRAPARPCSPAPWPAPWPCCSPWAGCSSTSAGSCSGGRGRASRTRRSRSRGCCGGTVLSWTCRSYEGPRGAATLLGDPRPLRSGPGADGAGGGRGQRAGGGARTRPPRTDAAPRPARPPSGVLPGGHTHTVNI